MATVIGEVYTGHWNDWQQASRLNSSFGYGSPTNLGAIGMGAIRFSLGRSTTENHIQAVLAVLRQNIRS